MCANIRRSSNTPLKERSEVQNKVWSNLCENTGTVGMQAANVEVISKGALSFSSSLEL